MHCMLMDLLHGFEVLSTTEETLFNSRNVSRLVENNIVRSVMIGICNGPSFENGLHNYLVHMSNL